ncbi:MAG TPA: nuclease-related domain-containing protein [Pseudogracilibacillus sp.]|nr:nuclease-related domain-containing protein [Pseudogracilibacillus sp.]
MAYKTRTKSEELLITEFLNNRMKLSNKDKQHYLNLKKGYEGEVLFDTLTEKLQCDCLILNDLLLQANSTTFQIDTLILLQKMVFFYEVKNYEGDYYYDSEKLFKKSKREILNPLLQLARSESLLRQLIFSLGFKPQIDASVLFINSKFTMYQAPLDQPFIFPTQITNYLNQLNATPSRITDRHYQLADKLISLHMTRSPYKQIPSYSYRQLRKGIVCANCHSFSVNVIKWKCVCKTFRHEELVADAVIRSVREFKMLFPNEKITTNLIHDWCRIVPSKQRIRKYLRSNYKVVGVRQWTYFE